MKCTKRTGFCVQKRQIKPQKVAKNPPFVRYRTGIRELERRRQMGEHEGGYTSFVGLIPTVVTADCLLPTSDCLLSVFPRQRDSDLKRRALPRLAESADCSPMGFGDPFPDGQSQTRASGLARACPVGAEKAFEDMGKSPRRGFRFQCRGPRPRRSHRSSSGRP